MLVLIRIKIRTRLFILMPIQIRFRIHQNDAAVRPDPQTDPPHEFIYDNNLSKLWKRRHSSFNYHCVPIKYYLITCLFGVINEQNHLVLMWVREGGEYTVHYNVHAGNQSVRSNDSRWFLHMTSLSFSFRSLILRPSILSLRILHPPSKSSLFSAFLINPFLPSPISILLKLSYSIFPFLLYSLLLFLMLLSFFFSLLLNSLECSFHSLPSFLLLSFFFSHISSLSLYSETPPHTLIVLLLPKESIVLFSFSSVPPSFSLSLIWSPPPPLPCTSLPVTLPFDIQCMVGKCDEFIVLHYSVDFFVKKLK